MGVVALGRLGHQVALRDPGAVKRRPTAAGDRRMDDAASEVHRPWYALAPVADHAGQSLGGRLTEPRDMRVVTGAGG